MKTTCPRCRTEGDFPKVEMENDDSGSAILLLGGFTAWLLHRAGQRNRVQCNHCRLIFLPKQPRSRIEVVLGVTFLLAVGACVAWLIYEETRSPLALPHWPLVVVHNAQEAAHVASRYLEALHVSTNDFVLTTPCSVSYERIKGQNTWIFEWPPKRQQSHNLRVLVGQNGGLNCVVFTGEYAMVDITSYFTNANAPSFFDVKTMGFEIGRKRK